MLLDILINTGVFVFMCIAILILLILLWTRGDSTKNKYHKLEMDLIRYQGEMKDKDLVVEKLQTEMKGQAQEQAVKWFDGWKLKELDAYKKIADEYATEAAVVVLQKWKIDEEARIRKDAANRSVRNVLGKVTEHLIPFSEAMNMFNPKDIRFMGSPIDLVVFEGAEQLTEVNIHFVEVKTGTSALSKRQQLIKSAIENKRVFWKRVTM
ncbi:MAG: Holliday junction resolvase-like protein, partial [Bacteroidota bacterium]